MSVGSENVSEDILVRLNHALINGGHDDALLRGAILLFSEDEDSEGDEIDGCELYEFGGADDIMVDSSILYDHDVFEASIYDSMEYEDGVTTLWHTWNDEEFGSVAKVIFPEPTGKIKNKKNFTFKGCWNKCLEELLQGYLDTDRVLHLTSDETGNTAIISVISPKGYKPLEISTVKPVIEPLVSAICDTFGDNAVSEVYFMCTNGKPWSHFISKRGAKGETLVLY